MARLKRADVWGALQTFLGAIPFRKMSGAQSFDFACDILNFVFVGWILYAKVDLGTYGDLLKPALVLQAIGFTAWSLHSNT